MIINDGYEHSKYKKAESRQNVDRLQFLVLAKTDVYQEPILLWENDLELKVNVNIVILFFNSCKK